MEAKAPAPLRIGFIGFGEAAFNIAKGLRGAGLKGIHAYDLSWDREPHGRLIRERADEAQVTLADSLESLIRESGIVMSTVQASVAVALAKESAQWLRPGQTYADLNSAGPLLKQQAAAAVNAAGALFVDGAIMGTVPGLGHAVPMLLCGNGAAGFADSLGPYGMRLTVLEGEPGRASASKLLRSVFMKGVVALLLETVIAGHEYDLEDDLLGSIAETFSAGPFLEVVNGLIARGVIHAERRAGEMNEVISVLESLGVDATMSVATREKLLRVAATGYKEHFGGIAPKDFHEIFQIG